MVNYSNLDSYKPAKEVFVDIDDDVGNRLRHRLENEFIGDNQSRKMNKKFDHSINQNLLPKNL